MNEPHSSAPARTGTSWLARAAARLGGVLLIAVVAAALLAVWLERAGPAEPAVRAVRQARAAVLAAMVLASVGVPWLFSALAPPAGRSALAYLAVVPGPVALALVLAWLGAPPAEVEVDRAAALLLAYGMVLAAGCDLARVAGPGAGLLVPPALAFVATGSVLLAGPWVEMAPDPETASQRVALAVELNPLILATSVLPRYDLLRSEAIYERSVIGSMFVHRRPGADETIGRLAVLAVLMGVLGVVIPRRVLARA